MKQKDFLIWMLGFPIVCSISDFVNNYLIGNIYSDMAEGVTASVTVLIWFIIGNLLYKKN